MRRRSFIGMAGTAAGLAAFAPAALAAGGPAVEGLPKLATNAVPISPAERLQRVAKAGALMRAHEMDAVLVEAGSSLVYFTGVQWWRSERLTAAIITREGEIAIVTPFFEEPSVRETLAIDAEVLTWNEDEDPLQSVAAWLGRRGLGRGKIGIEETVRYFAVDGLQHALPEASIVNGAPVVRGCRMIKSPAELALMEIANDITMAAYRHAMPQVEPGMTPRDIGGLINAATRAMGGNPEFELVLLGEASAYPHGSGKPQEVREGEVILLDCGCNVHGYQSDISRSYVFGEPSARQRMVWNQMRKGQDTAFEAAQPGVAAGKVDDAVRAYYETLGYGPGYKLPGTSHRTGHGIGLDGHEPVNLVRGEETPLAPGMCFSDEPGIYIPGEFGIRLEDCFFMTESGPRWFSTPAPSIDNVFG
ncbi:Xaa-Pro dipeptidase [Altererythrobacter atlanticus]|uniref:Xaa-Pro dipeptidase n=1 Tax=Croceibacterium atlanticum TaxID=1267766 RepID=A0A0F7KQV2_9SPHN|nr:Xaa-Pro peptidase family protein [Croceibacterium atlanticum]AKH41562.1 Xaa-Pro dipeptidase [Croceibacterium atlanticum]MBB5733024.1 Xaa-Pro dipeptidase [Croceibacterium atlanticum]